MRPAHCEEPTSATPPDAAKSYETPNLPRSTGVFVRRYVVVDTRGQTRSLTEGQLRQRRTLLDLYGQNSDYLTLHYPEVIDGKKTGNFDVEAVADVIKRQALYNSYRINAEWHASLRQKGLRA